MGKQSKGSAFERAFCKELSLWWTGGTHDDWFWRSQTSGARATVRYKRGLGTRNNHGDVAPTTAAAEPLTNFMCIELKRGYTVAAPLDFMESTRLKGPSVLEQFIEQAEISAHAAGCPEWLMVWKRDRRNPIVYMSWSMAVDVTGMDRFPTSSVLTFPRKDSKENNKIFRCFAVPLSDYFKYVPARTVRKAAQKYQK